MVAHRFSIDLISSCPYMEVYDLCNRWQMWMIRDNRHGEISFQHRSHCISPSSISLSYLILWYMLYIIILDNIPLVVGVSWEAKSAYSGSAPDSLILERKNKGSASSRVYVFFFRCSTIPLPIWSLLFSWSITFFSSWQLCVSCSCSFCPNWWVSLSLLSFPCFGPTW